jgi:hypothetical protein
MRDQPIEECMTCGGKCLRKVCDHETLSAGGPDAIKQCFGEMMKDPEKKEAMRDCYKQCMDTDEPVHEMVEEVHEEVHEGATEVLKAVFRLDDIEFSVEAMTKQDKP